MLNSGYMAIAHKVSLPITMNEADTNSLPFTDHLVAVAVPDPEVFAPFASAITGQSVSATDPAALKAACEDKKVTAALLSELIKLGRESNLKGFEIPRALKLRAEPFSAENGLLTPTFKMKRPEARKILAKEIDWLYSQPPAKM